MNIAARNAVVSIFVVTACASESGPDGIVPQMATRARELPCELEIIATGVELWSDLKGTVPDPRWPVAAAPNGRYYTNTSTGGAVAVWTAEGRFERIVGTSGQGPGELEGFITPFVDSAANLHTRDNALSWSVFDSTGMFLRRMPARYIGAIIQHTHFLFDGRVLTSHAGLRADNPAYFHLVAPDGELVKSFGHLSEDDMKHITANRGALRRTTAYGGGQTFWAAARSGSPRGYELEEWDLEGNKLRIIRREASWFISKKRRDSTVEGAQVIALYVDRAGLLLVYSVVPRESKEPGGAGDIHFEIIDPAAGIVLAAGETHNASLSDYSALPWWFGGSRTGYQTISTPEGVPGVRMLRYELVSRGTNADSRCR